MHTYPVSIVDTIEAHRPAYNLFPTNHPQLVCHSSFMSLPSKKNSTTLLASMGTNQCIFLLSPESPTSFHTGNVALLSRGILCSAYGKVRRPRHFTMCVEYATLTALGCGCASARWRTSVACSGLQNRCPLRSQRWPPAPSNHCPRSRRTAMVSQKRLMGASPLGLVCTVEYFGETCYSDVKKYFLKLIRALIHCILSS